MGISRDSRHKRRLTGGRMPIHKKKRLYESGRPQASTKLGEKRVRRIRVRGGNYKFRALRINEGNINWASEGIAKKTKVLDVVYNASNNELVRTKTLVKNCIVQIDATPFKQWYLAHYNVDLSSKKAKAKKEGEQVPETKRSRHVIKKLEARNKERFMDPKLEEQFNTGRLLVCVSSRPGQSGRCDGYLLEGKELEFYIKKIEKKK
jgi:small subunit ribosomal protein S8e